ncbi:MAG: transglutaminase domain-containing protein [Nitrospirae bacterium]|nr:transglutaminase domain-containing protein [Nitrospirota bacterium]
MLNRRDFLKGSFLLAGYALTGLDGISLASGIKDSDVRSVTLKITYTTEILRPPKQKGIDIWIPLPQTDKEQEVSSLVIDSPVKYSTEKSGQNWMIYLRADRFNEGDRVNLHYTLRRKATGIVTIPDEIPQQYLKPSEWERWDSNITAFVDRVAGKEKNPLRIGRLLYDAIIDRSTYVHEVCGRGVSTLFFEEKVGRCDEFHALFRSMMMYKGIPVRWEQGVALPYPSQIKKEGEFEADCINAHSWVRFYIGNGRWFPVDVSEAKRRPDLRDYYFGRLVPNRMKVSTGRGIMLSPKQQGIINTFAYTYIEAGGLPAIYGHNYKNTIRYKLLDMEA